MSIVLEDEEALFDVFNTFIERSSKRIYDNHLPSSYNDFMKCFMEKQGIVVNTIHGVKGEEFTTVIAFGLLNGRLPNWQYITNPEKKHLRNTETKKLLYVLISRAKENLYMFSEKGYLTSNQNPYTPTEELVNVDFDYD